MTFSQSSSGSSKCSLANFRRAWTCTGLSRGTRLALQDLSPWRRSVLLMVAFVTLIPALCRSFTRSPVWFWDFCSQFLWLFWPHGVRFLRRAPDRGRLSVVLYVFHFLIIAPTVDFFTPSCLPIADSVFPSLVQVYNFVSGVLWQLFGLGHSGIWSVTVWGCGQVSFILITSSKQMTLIQGNEWRTERAS